MKPLKIPHLLSALVFFLGIAPGWGAVRPTATPSPTPVETDYSKATQDLERFIQDEMDKHHVKGLSIVLVDGDRVVWVKGFGWANGEKMVRSGPDTLYHLGAVSKIFTAAEVMRLAQRGQIGLDRPIQAYLPGFSIHSRFKRVKPITVRSLLANHSGLPGFFLKGLWVDSPESLSDFVTDLQDDYLTAPPQTLYKYSYVDYDLLGRLVEVKRRKGFAEALKKDLFDPLGMDASSFDDSSDRDPRLAKGYRHGNPVPLTHLRDVPAGGMVSSAADLAKFLQFLLGGKTPGKTRPLSQKSLAKMFEPAYPGLPLDFGHEGGLGWLSSGITLEGSEGLAWRDGVYPPYNAQVAVLYRQGLGLALLSNCTEGDLLQGDVTERALKLMLQAKFGIVEDLKKKKIEMPKTVEVPPDQLEMNGGTYSAMGQLMKIARKENHLTVDFQGHQLDLLPVAEETYVPHLTFLFFPIDLPQFPLTFSGEADSRVAVLGGWTFPIPFQKITPVDIPQAWKEREGDYTLENGDGFVEFNRISLGEKEGFLLVDMKVTLPPFDIKDQEFKVALMPLSDGDAVVPGLFYGDGGTLHVDNDDPSRVFYSGYWFVKKPVPGATPVEPVSKPVVLEATPLPSPTLPKPPSTPAITPTEPSPHPVD